ncbi:type II toxin-antitoxin system RelE family toxin [Neoaquamicrobium sediminum]|uniref:ParE-like toxin domain-containing protein n=1 Tax=Neoaquamicrobium sediminum TaxID=1849104 RepID=A0ABV3WX30_9HYPH
MNHFATADFWDCYQRLPAAVQRIADRNFERLKADPYHPSLHFKQAGRFWSARVGLQYRALAVRDGDDMIWFWIGTHADYDRLVG